MKSEIELVNIAQSDRDDDKANAAMKELRERFDKTYMWCMDCDGAVVKEAECCLNVDMSNVKIEF